MSLMFLETFSSLGSDLLPPLNYIVEYKQKNGPSRVVQAIYKPYGIILGEMKGRTYFWHQFEAFLSDLVPNTQVSYRIGVNRTEGIHWYDEVAGSFTSAQAPPVVQPTATQVAQLKSAGWPLQPSYPFKWLAFGDMDTGVAASETVRNLRSVVDRDPNIRFALHVGDLAYAWFRQERKWNDWQDLVQPIASKIPYMTCVGNHEDQNDFAQYIHRFSTSPAVNSGSTGGTLWNSWDYANVHFIALSSEHPYLPNSKQYQWLEYDLKRVDRRKTPFVITMIHRPFYSSNKNHGSEEKLRIALEPLLHRYGVDLALFGHVHAYERTCAVYNKRCSDEKGFRGHTNVYVNPTTVHVHAGTAGFELNPEWDEPAPAWSRYRETNHGFMRFEMLDETTLKGEFLRNDPFGENPTVADTFYITKMKMQNDGFQQLPMQLQAAIASAVQNL